MVDPGVAVSNRTSFRELVEEHKQAVYRLALDLTGNHHDAEDLSQEVFIKALKGLDGFRGDSAVGTWLHSIAVRTYLNRARKKTWVFVRYTGDPIEEAPQGTTETLPDEAAETSLLRRRIDAALDQLSAKERSAFVLRHYHDMKVAEVAAALGVADGTVKSLLFRAARKLRKTLEPLRSELLTNGG